MMPLVESGRSGRDKVVSAVDAVQLIRPQMLEDWP